MNNAPPLQHLSSNIHIVNAMIAGIYIYIFWKKCRKKLKTGKNLEGRMWERKKEKKKGKKRKKRKKRREKRIQTNFSYLFWLFNVTWLGVVVAMYPL